MFEPSPWPSADRHADNHVYMVIGLGIPVSFLSAVARHAIEARIERHEKRKSDGGDPGGSYCMPPTPDWVERTSPKGLGPNPTRRANATT